MTETISSSTFHYVADDGKEWDVSLTSSRTDVPLLPVGKVADIDDVFGRVLYLFYFKHPQSPVGVWNA